MNTPLTPVLVLNKNKKQKPEKVCPPDKVLNLKTNRCIKVKPVKTVRQLINDRKDALQEELKKKIKECPAGKELNLKTGRCIKIKQKTIKIKKEPKMKIKECPPGKELNPKTGRCIAVKTRKNKSL